MIYFIIYYIYPTNKTGFCFNHMAFYADGFFSWDTFKKEIGQEQATLQGFNEISKEDYDQFIANKEINGSNVR